MKYEILEMSCIALSPSYVAKGGVYQTPNLDDKITFINVIL